MAPRTLHGVAGFCFAAAAGAVRDRVLELEDLSASEGQQGIWLFGRNDSEDFVGCPAGLHKQLNRWNFDHHPRGVNPNCRAYEDDVNCEEEEHHLVIPGGMLFGDIKTADCAELLRTPPLFDVSDEVWDFADTLGHDELYGQMTVRCAKDRKSGKPTLTVAKHNCRELLPFSVVDHFDTAAVDRTEMLWWETRGVSGPWSTQEVKIFDCGVAPASITLKSFTRRQDYDAAFLAATIECAADKRCKAVGIEKATGHFHLLSRFHCEPGQFSAFSTLEEGQKVRWRGWPSEAPSQRPGRVLSRWDLKSARDLVDVSFPDVQELQRIHVTNLERVDVAAPWTVIYNLRERSVVCEPLQDKHTCDVSERKEAAVLFRNDSKTADDCRLACKGKASTSRFTLGKKGCCTFSKGVCALSMGELFRLQEDLTAAEGDEDATPFSQKRSLEDANAPEFAGFCYEQPCGEDPLCSFDGRLDFDAPEDIPTDEAADDERVTVYFDFAHPLSLPFAYYTGDDGVHVFHFSSKQKAALDLGPSDKRRLVRAVGTVPASSSILADLPDLEEPTLYRGRATRPFGNASGSNSTEQQRRLSAARSQPGKSRQRVAEHAPSGSEEHSGARPDIHRTGYVPTRGRIPGAVFDHMGETLQGICEEHGRLTSRDLRVPVISLETREECMRLHGNINAPLFEPCLVSKGCEAVDREARWVPFHGPWLSKLPFDILAWQQPAPFCCVVPYNTDRRDEKILRQFFRDIDFQDPSKVDLSSVSDQGAQAAMRSSLSSGGRAMKKLLAYDIHDEGTLEWLAGFIQAATDKLSNYIADLQETVDSEGDDVELSEDGDSFLEIHEEGSHVAPSGRRAFPLARWSSERGAFIQLAHAGPEDNATVAETNTTSTLSKIWSTIRRVPGAIYNYGMRPLWNHVFKPLARWGFSVAKWIVEHPRAALFISKIALSIRDRLCEKASYSLYDAPETQAVGAFTSLTNSMSETVSSFKQTFSPAVLLVGLQKSLANSNFVQRMKSLGTATFGIVMSWAGLATGGAAAALIGGITSLLADAAIDASQQALEFMMYREIAKEIPSNLYDMLFKKCLYKQEAQRQVTLGATVDEMKGAASATIEAVTAQVTSASSKLLTSMKGFADFFASSSDLELSSTLAEFNRSTSILHRSAAGRRVRPEM